MLLIAHDTTCIDYSSLHSDGLGRNSIAKHSRGFLLHSGLAMTEGGVPLGVLSQSIWTRHEVRRLGSKAPGMAIEDKESGKWMRSFSESASAIPEGVRGGMLMSEMLGSQPVIARYEYGVQRVHEARPKRKARMAVRACEVEIQRPGGESLRMPGASGSMRSGRRKRRPG